MPQNLMTVSYFIYAAWGGTVWLWHDKCANPLARMLNWYQNGISIIIHRRHCNSRTPIVLSPVNLPLDIDETLYTYKKQRCLLSVASRSQDRQTSIIRAKIIFRATVRPQSEISHISVIVFGSVAVLQKPTKARSPIKSLSVCLPVCLSVCLFVCVCVCSVGDVMALES